MSNKRKKKKKHLHIETERRSKFTQILTHVFVVKAAALLGILAFLMLFAPVFTPQTGRIALLMFGARGVGFALIGAILIWISLLLAGHIWDLKPVGPEEWETFHRDFLKRAGICLAVICLFAVLSGVCIYFGTDNARKAAADDRSGYVQASGVITDVDYDHHRHGPGEYKYTLALTRSTDGEVDASEMIVAVYRRIRAENTGDVLRQGDYGKIYYYPQTHVIDHVVID